MRLFIAGATGYTGRALTELGSKAALHTIAHIRPGSSQLAAAQHEFDALGAVVCVAPWTLEAMREALLTHRPDVLFCAIGTTKARMKQLADEDASYEAVDFGLTKMLVDAALSAHDEDASYALPRFVYISSMGVSPGARNAYMKARYRAEQCVIQSGLPYAIARPGFISGEDRKEQRTMERVGATVSDLALKAVGALGAKRAERAYRSTDAAELARALIRLAQSPKAALIVEAHALKDDSPDRL